MEKINTIEIIEELEEQQNNERPVGQKNWTEVLNEVVKETNNFSIEDMCTLCIAKQKKDYGDITITCSGLTTYKNTIVKEYGEGIYESLIKTVNPEVLEVAEELANPNVWINKNITNTKLFTSRPHQIMINSCSANKKVLRMGRRCVSSNTKIKGFKKNYSVKHLFNLFKKEKTLPFILAFDEETNKLVKTNKYIIMPNGVEKTYKLILENGFSVSITGEHPLIVYSNKHYHFKEAKDITIDDYIITEEDNLVKIRSIELQEPEFTYHVSVLKYQTFITNGGFIHHNTGKALDIRTPIPTPNGWKTMGDLQIGDKVFDDNGKECNVTFVTEYQYERDCYEITFDNGDTIIADADHQWAVSLRDHRRKAIQNGYNVADIELVLQTKDLLDFENKHYAIRLPEPVEYTKKELTVNPYVLGYWLGDGNTDTTILTIGDEDREESLKRIREYGYDIKSYAQKFAYKLENVFADFKQLGVINNKHIPFIYLQSSVNQRLELLRGLLDSDGSYNYRDDTIEYTSSNEILALNVKELLASLGIKTSVRKNKSFLKGTQHRYRLVFKTHLKVFNLKRKDLNSKEKTNTRSSYLYIKSITPVETRPVKCISVDSKRSLYLATKNYIVTHNTYAMAVGMLHRMLTRKDYKVLMVAPMATMIDEVVEQIKKFCENLPEDPLISSTASPIAFMEFNTGSTFKGITAGASGAKGVRGKSANLLYIDECFPARTRIRMADGSNKAIEEIEVGEYVLSFCEKTKKLVTRKVLAKRCTGFKRVYQFKTVSGKKLSSTNNHPFYTREGWKEACEANSIATIDTKVGDYFFESIIGSRFKSIEKVYNLEVEGTHTYIAEGFIVHNCDFLNSKDLNSILGILMDSPDTEFWASSTPIGEHNLFRLSKDPEFKEFHFPSYVIPHYSDKVDRTLRNQMTETGYIQEVLGLFSSSDAGVFQIKFIEQACVENDLIFNEEYIQANRQDFILIIGVDWNHDKVGTRVVVVGYHKPSGRYFIVSKDRVAREGWTQLDAVQKIVDLNRKYNVDHIYVDEGFGTSQASLLRQFGLNQYGQVGPNHPDLTLTETVAVNFSSTLVLRDPTTGEELRKQTKQYIVEHTADLLGRGVIVLHVEKDNDIIQQMKNYVVKAITARGLKTFAYRDAQIADHDLDAFMIALHGFHQEYSEFNTNGPIVGISSILNKNNEDPNSYLGVDRMETTSFSSNLVINTRKSIVENRFNKSRNSGFKQRKRW